MTKRLILVLLVAIYSSSAYAYIDPGSGSAIMTAVVGFFVAVGLALKTYWYKFKSLFTRKEPVKEPSDKDSADHGKA